MKHLKRNSTLYLPVVKAFANVSAKPPVPYKMDKTLSEIPLRVKSKHTSRLCLMQDICYLIYKDSTLRTMTGLLALRERLTMLSDCRGSPPTTKSKDGMGSTQPV